MRAIDDMIASAGKVNEGIDHVLAAHDEVLAERKQALELLAWAMAVLEINSPIVTSYPNWTRVCLAVADAKARGII